MAKSESILLIILSLVCESDMKDVLSVNWDLKEELSVNKVLHY